jgi:hypothetical protein
MRGRRYVPRPVVTVVCAAIIEVMPEICSEEKGRSKTKRSA